MVESIEELRSLQPYVYSKWLAAGGNDAMFRLWTNGREPIENTNIWYWDDGHKIRKRFCFL